MLKFEVSFFKEICDSTGHSHRAHQMTVVVRALDEIRAATAAQEAFCQSAVTTDWRTHADEFVIKLLGPAKDDSGDLT